MIGLGRDLRDEEIVLLEDWHAGTYGIPDGKTIDAIRLCARLEGVLTDPVYEGKSMAALIDLIQSGRIKPGSRVLYAHLGGQPVLNAHAGAFGDIRPARRSPRRIGFSLKHALAARASSRGSDSRLLSSLHPIELRTRWRPRHRAARGQREIAAGGPLGLCSHGSG